MAPGLRHVNGEVTRGFFYFYALTAEFENRCFAHRKCDATVLQMKKTGVYKRSVKSFETI